MEVQGAEEPQSLVGAVAGHVVRARGMSAGDKGSPTPHGFRARLPGYHRRHLLPELTIQMAFTRALFGRIPGSWPRSREGIIDLGEGKRERG